MVYECNACMEEIAEDEICFRTLGNLYHLKCEKDLQPGTPKLKLSAKEAVNMSTEEFRKRTGQ